MILHHGEAYGPDKVSEMDPLGATHEALVELVEWATSDEVKFVEKVAQENTLKNNRREIEALVFKRLRNTVR